MNTYVFTKFFTRVMLKGLSRKESLTFESDEQFDNYVQNINRKHYEGRLDYYIG